MGKAALRSLWAGACRMSGVLGRRERAALDQLQILCYHRILPAAEKEAYFCPDLVVTPEAFRAQCGTLADHYRVLPLAEALDALRSGPQDKPLVALTFDDGYVDNLMYAAPILSDFGQRATFFVVSDLMGTTIPPWYDFVARCVADLAARGEGCAADGNPTALELGLGPMDLVEGAKAFPPEDRSALAERLAERLGGAPAFPPQDLVMDATQVQELVAGGHEIGSHSVSHEILPLLDRTFVLPGGRLADEYREIQDDHNHWDPFAIGGIDRFEVPGDHDSMVLEPHVRVLGAKVRQVLRDALARTAPLPT